MCNENSSVEDRTRFAILFKKYTKEKKRKKKGKKKCKGGKKIENF